MNGLQEMKMDIESFFHENKLTQAIMWLFAGGFPIYLALAANYISYGSSDELNTLLQEHTGSFLYGLFLVFIIYIALVCLCKKVSAAALLSALIFTLMPLIDYFKSSILQEHFLPWDLLLAKNALSFTEFLTSLKAPAGTWQIICCTVFYWAFLALMKPTLPGKRRIHIIAAPILLIFLWFFVTTPAIRNTYPTIFGIHWNEAADQRENYKQNGFLTAFALNFGSLNMPKPLYYSKSYLEHTFEPYIPTDATGENFQNPDIIVVLSESFWDPTVLNGVTFSDDPLKNYHRIAAKHPSGKMVSGTFGGGTVRPEFEILTGMTTSMLPPGNIPYQQYVYDDIFSYARHFQSLGYDTLGLHTYQKTFYSRDKAYPLMGFDDFLGEYDMHAEQHWNSGPYITDETIAEEIIYQLEQPHETGLYLTAITMENHGLYYDKYDPSEWDITVESSLLSEQEKNILQNFAKGTSDSDRALGVLYDYIMSREKPTVLLWYGDHLPTLGDDFSPYITTGNITSTTATEWSEEEKRTMFSTPYVIFANYDTGKEYLAEGVSVSPYLLSPLMCDYISAPECLQTNFLLELYEACPVISPYYQLYTAGVPKNVREKYYQLHKLLTYDELIGEKYLKQTKETER